MIEKETVFVLGAGASADLRFPIGARLYRDIYELTKGSVPCFSRTEFGGFEKGLVGNAQLVWRLLDLAEEKKENGATYSVDDVEEFGKALWLAQANSIDEFIALRSEYALIGKIAILLCLSKYEDPNLLMPSYNGEGSYDYPNVSWYKFLWQKISAGATSIQDLHENKLTILTFNYDRSLDHYLFNAIKNKYGVSEEGRIANVFKRIKIFHVYGETGCLPWKFNNFPEAREDTDLVHDYNRITISDLIPLWGAPNVYYENEISTTDGSVWSESDQKKFAIRLMKRIKRIRAFTEITQNRKEYHAIFQRAERVYILGFGYLLENMEAIGLVQNTLPNNSHIYACAYSFSASETEKFRRYLAPCLQPDRGYLNWRENVKVLNRWDQPFERSSVIESFLRDGAVDLL